MGTNERKRRVLQRQMFAILLIILGCAYVYYKIFVSTGSAQRYQMHFEGSGVKNAKFSLETASTPRTRERGLMFRKEMKENEGMVFIFPEEGPHSFWMKNTYIPLDMIFLDKDMKIRGILHKVPILNLEPRSIEEDSQYIIELNGRAAEKSGLSAGNRAVFDDPLPKPE